MVKDTSPLVSPVTDASNFPLPPGTSDTSTVLPTAQSVAILSLIAVVPVATSACPATAIDTA
eukprot:3019745-Rhodomonas_salina.1